MKFNYPLDIEKGQSYIAALNEKMSPEARMVELFAFYQALAFLKDQNIKISVDIHGSVMLECNHMKLRTGVLKTFNFVSQKILSLSKTSLLSPTASCESLSSTQSTIASHNVNHAPYFQPTSDLSPALQFMSQSIPVNQESAWHILDQIFSPEMCVHFQSLYPKETSALQCIDSNRLLSQRYSEKKENIQSYQFMQDIKEFYFEIEQHIHRLEKNGFFVHSIMPIILYDRYEENKLLGMAYQNKEGGIEVVKTDKQVTRLFSQNLKDSTLLESVDLSVFKSQPLFNEEGILNNQKIHAFSFLNDAHHWAVFDRVVLGERLEEFTSIKEQLGLTQNINCNCSLTLTNRPTYYKI